MLRWPTNWERTPPERRSAAYLGLERIVSERSLLDTLQQMGARHIEVTCNPTWRDGQGLVRMPADTGVSLWFLDDHGDRYVLACDTYMTVRDNITALYFLAEGMRHAAARGAGVAVAKMFMGLIVTEQEYVGRVTQEAPPSPPADHGSANWWNVFGFSMLAEATLTMCEKKYRAMVKRIHPDKPDGDAEAMRIWTEAIQSARQHFKESK